VTRAGEFGILDSVAQKDDQTAEARGGSASGAEVDRPTTMDTLSVRAIRSPGPDESEGPRERGMPVEIHPPVIPAQQSATSKREADSTTAVRVKNDKTDPVGTAGKPHEPKHAAVGPAGGGLGAKAA